jgi:hypothetical protein
MTITAEPPSRTWSFVRNSRNALAPLRQDQQGLGSLHGRIDTEVLPCSVLVADEGCHFFRC